MTVTDRAGNATPVALSLPAVVKGDQTLVGFVYGASSVLFTDTPPAVTAPGGVKTSLSYATASTGVCGVNANTGALNFVGLGDCVVTATAAATGNYNAASVMFTVTVGSAGVLALNVSAVATDNVVNIAEKAAGFSVAGNTGDQDGVTVSLPFGIAVLTATSAADGTWSAAVPPNAAYLTEPGVVLTAGATKTGYTAAADVVRTVTVDLTAPSVSYTPPRGLQVDHELLPPVSPETADTDVASYADTDMGLPVGLEIDEVTGVISGTPTKAGVNTTVTVTVTDDAGNPTGVSVRLPQVFKGNQRLTGFAYSAASVVYGQTVPTVIPPTGAKTTLSYAATPPEVCTVTAGDGALTLVEVGECEITVIARLTLDYREGRAEFTVNVLPAGTLVLNVPAVARDDVVNIAEKAAGFVLGGDTGADDGATVSVSLGSGSLSATSGGGGAWSVDVPAAAAYLAEPSVALTVTARKTGLTAAMDVVRTLTVDLVAPAASYTAPGTLQVGVALAPLNPATTDTDVASYAAVGLPEGIEINPGTGVISGTPTTPASAAVTVTVTVTDDAGNPTEVLIPFSVVLKGDQPLSGFAYSATSGVFGQPPPTVTPPTGAVTALVYAAVPEGVCGVDSGTGALSLVEVGECVITVTAVDTAAYNEAAATSTVTVLPAGTLVVNVSPVTGDDVVNIAEKAAGFTISGNTGGQDGVAVTLSFGSGSLSATSGADGTWSVDGGAAYVTEPSVTLTASTRKVGYTSSSDLVRTVTVDLTAPVVEYVVSSLKVGEPIARMRPVDPSSDIESYGVDRLPAGLEVAEVAGVISGTPTTGGVAVTTTVRVTDEAGNETELVIRFPAIAQGDQVLSAFAYSAETVVFGQAAPEVTAPQGAATSLSYSAAPADVCSVEAETGVLTLIAPGECATTVTAAETEDYNQADESFTVTVLSAGRLALNLDAVAGDNVVNGAERTAGFAVSGDTGIEAEVTVTVTVGIGSESLSATSDAQGQWSVAVAAEAGYLNEPSVVVTVSASKVGLTAASDVERTVAVDLTAPEVSYAAPDALQVGVEMAEAAPASTHTDIASYAAPDLPAGLEIDEVTGVISGTPAAAGSAATVAVTVADRAGNETEASIGFPAVAKGERTLRGFAYSSSATVFGRRVPTVTPPTVTGPGGEESALSYAAAPAEVCRVEAATGELTLVGPGECVVTVTAAATDDYNEAGATFTVTVTAAGTLALNVAAVAGDNAVNRAEQAAGFAVSGDSGIEAGVAVTVRLGTGTLEATSDARGAWSVDVPAGAAYLSEPSVALRVSAVKSGFAAATDVVRTVTVDLTAPAVSYAAPSALYPGVPEVMNPVSTDTDIASYAAEGLPAGFDIDESTGVISGTAPAVSPTATATVTVTDRAGNESEFAVAFPAVTALPEGTLLLSVAPVAGNDVVDGAEKAAGFAVSGRTGIEAGVAVTVRIGNEILRATSGADGSWSVEIPANAGYVTEPSVTVTVSAGKDGQTPPADVVRTVTVNLTAPAATRVRTVAVAPPAGGDGWQPGESVEVRVTFSRVVTVDTSGGRPWVRVVLSNGGPAGSASLTASGYRGSLARPVAAAEVERRALYVRGSGTTVLTFAYELVEADGRVSSVAVPRDAVMLGGGMIRDAAGAEVEVGHEGTTSTDVLPEETVSVLRVADARAPEGGTLSFRVTLSPSSSSAVTVEWATRDGTASSGADYAAGSGVLEFVPGETVKRVLVGVWADDDVDGVETLTVVLSNATGAEIADGEGRGTIVSADGTPRGWAGRFGRTAAGQVLEAVKGQLAAARRTGFEGRLAGRGIGVAGDAAWGSGEHAGTPARRPWGGDGATGAKRGWTADGPGLTPFPGVVEGLGPGPWSWREVTGRDLLMGTSFAMSGGTAAGGISSLWGRGVLSRFKGVADDVALDGEVASGMLGVDWSKGPWTTGILLSYARGEGDYSSPQGGGAVESTLSGLYPYGRYRLTRRLSLWGVAGHGSGETRFMAEGAADEVAADLNLDMVAGGGSGLVLTPGASGGLELAVKAEAMAVRTKTAPVPAMVLAEKARTMRVGFGLEGKWHGFEMAGGPWTPMLEIAVRQDGGDAETGFGADIGAGLSWAAAEHGLEVELRARQMLVHEDKSLRDYGFTASLTWDRERSSDRGPSFTLRQTVGANDADGMEALLSRETLAGFAAAGNDPGRRLEARLGYGLPAFGGSFTVAPEIGFALTDSDREYSLGWRLSSTASRLASVLLDLEGTRRESVNDGRELEYGVGLKLQLRW